MATLIVLRFLEQQHHPPILSLAKRKKYVDVFSPSLYAKSKMLGLEIRMPSRWDIVILNCVHKYYLDFVLYKQVTLNDFGYS